MADQQVAVVLFLENLPVKLVGGSMILLGFGRLVLVVLCLVVASKIVCAAIREIALLFGANRALPQREIETAAQLPQLEVRDVVEFGQEHQSEASGNESENNEDTETDVDSESEGNVESVRRFSDDFRFTWDDQSRPSGFSRSCPTGRIHEQLKKINRGSMVFESAT